jgi:multidrug efflux system membrane fusion protein
MRTTHRKWVRRLLLLTILIVGIAWLSGRYRRTGKPVQANAIPSVPVVATRARKGNLPIYLNGLGSVEAYYTVTVRTRVDGQLLRFNVAEGQIVKADDLIAEIDPRPFEVQLEQAEGQMGRDQAILANAKLDLERYRVLAAQNAIPKQLLDTQAALVNQYEAIVRQDQGVINAAKLQLVYTRITSPIPGRIGLRQVDPGNIVHAADANGIAVITQLQPITVVFNLGEQDISSLVSRLQTGKRLAVEAYDRPFKHKLATGSLLTFDNLVDPNTGTIRLKALFQNRDNILFPNEFVNARLLIDTLKNTVLVPAAAVQRGPQTVFVFVVKPDNTIELRNVKLGPIEGEIASIEQGLAPGEVVVTEGVDKLQQGSRVTTREANPK